MEVEKDNDLEFEALVKEFTTDVSAAEYTNFDENFPNVLSQWSMNSKSIGNNGSEKTAINVIQNQEIASD